MPNPAFKHIDEMGPPAPEFPGWNCKYCAYLKQLYPDVDMVLCGYFKPAQIDFVPIRCPNFMRETGADDDLV